ncbi:hypothetical protein ACSS31_27225 (plasmid) [Priestia megaterium]|jgi:hypothetical protein
MDILKTIFITVISGIMITAFYDFLKHIIKNPDSTIASAFSLPEIKLLKYSALIMFLAIVLYFLIKS